MRNLFYYVKTYAAVANLQHHILTIIINPSPLVRRPLQVLTISAIFDSVFSVSFLAWESGLSDRAICARRDAQGTRTQIIEQAVRLIAAGGYHRGIFMEVAAAIGVSPGTIAYHFRTRELLLEAVVVHLQGLRHTLLNLAAKDAPRGSARIDYAIDVYARLLDDPVFLAFAEIERLARVDPMIHTIIAAAQEAFDRAEDYSVFELVQGGGAPRLQASRDLARFTLEGMSGAKLSFDSDDRKAMVVVLLKRATRMLNRKKGPGVLWPEISEVLGEAFDAAQRL